MTNFEKWKAMVNADEICEMVWRLRCRFCPKMKLLKPGPNFCNSLKCQEEFMKWANTEAEETKYIVRCDADVGSACIFCSFWDGKCFVKGEENAKTFNSRESAEEELNRFGYSPKDYSILTTEN